MTDAEYKAAELYNACPLPVMPENKNGIIRLKIMSDRGTTRWMNISPAQFKAIEAVLTKEEK